MQMMNTGYRSIGEVLATLKQEFPDVTISKIRFLEAQELITPKRSASGYRQFSEDDIARLRYILRQQKENFLPLKVIKGRLNDKTPIGGEKRSGRGGALGIEASTTEGANLGRNELMRESGLSETQLKSLEDFGFIDGQRSANGVWYPQEAVLVAKLAARFFKFGIEPRHLRAYKTAAEREADLYKQLVVPVRTQRNTQAKLDARAKLDELSELGAALRDELLRQALAE